MDWIRENKVPAAIIGVSLAGVIGLGVVLYSSYSAYDEKMQQFNSVNMSLQGLKNGPLAPTQENVDAKNRLVTDYAAKVDQLGRVLVRLQKAPTPTTDVEFQSKLKSKIAAIRAYATQRGVGLPAVFNLGFDRYISELPASNQVATELSTYLDGLDETLRLLIDSGIESLETLERTELDAENGASAAPKAQPKAQPKGKAGPKGPPPPPAPAKVSERWPVRFVVKTDQAALQTLMSRLASPSDTQSIPYFPIVKLVRIENQVKEGPPRNMADTAAVPPGPEGVAAAPATPAAAAQGANADVIAAVQPADPDAVTIFGNEKLVVFLEVDFVRFLESAAAASR